VVASAVASGAIPTTPNPLTIGSRYNATAAGDHFSGAIDDVRVYGRGLNLQEVYDLAHPISVNFQLGGGAAPPGYVSDVGGVYGPQGNGLTYGWSSDHTDTARARGVNPDPRLDTLAQMHAGQRWEIALPNGTYRVYVSVGDASFGNFTPTLNIEGQNVYTDLTLAANQFQFVARTVTVSDGRLTIDQGNDADKELRINYVQIYSLNADVAPPTVTTTQFLDQQPVAAGRAHGVRLTFDGPVTGLSASSLQLTNLTTGQVVGGMSMQYEGLVATFTFPGYAGGVLPDGNYRAALPAGSVADTAGNRLAAAVSFDFFVLAGDANHDRVVNFADLLTLAKNYGKSGLTWSQGDFNYDGNVNFADLLILAKSYNKSLPAPSDGAGPASPESVMASAAVVASPVAAAAAKPTATTKPGVKPAAKPSAKPVVRKAAPPAPRVTVVAPPPPLVTAFGKRRISGSGVLG
jgi:hypothetical protein